MTDTSVTISIRDIYDRLLQTDQKLDDFIMEFREANPVKHMNDHEKRLRRVEAWMYAIPVALIAAVINAVTIWVARP